jgi:predicted transcriptional regulator
MTYLQLKKKLVEIRAEISSAFVSRNHGALIACIDRIEALYESAGSALLGRANRGKKIAVTEKSLAARRENGKKGGRPRLSVRCHESEKSIDT